MKLPALLRRRAEPAEVGGVARLDRRTKNLTKRLQPGEVAIIHHSDLDRVSAEALVSTGVERRGQRRALGLGPLPQPRAEHPARGRHPAHRRRRRGRVRPLVTEGDRLVVDGNRLLDADGAVVLSGTLVTTEVLEEQLEQARAGLSDQIDAFTLNTMTYLREEKELLLEGVGVPEIRTQIDGRHVLIVVRGYNYRGDLDVLRPYISEYKPLLIGVDGGADALLEAGYKPNMIIGDMDSCSDAALQSGAELVVHAYRDGRAPGVERVESLGLSAVVFPVLGTSEDAAMLLADSYGARLLVAVGTHYSLVEFLDKGREGMASTFLTRLRVGSKLVDAKGVSRIYRSQVKGWHLALLVLSGVVALVTALAMTDVGGAVGSLLVARLRDLAYWIKDSLTMRSEDAPLREQLINFRYHIVSLMAVFLALAVGIAVGVSLSPSVDEGILDAGRSRTASRSPSCATSSAGATASTPTAARTTSARARSCWPARCPTPASRWSSCRTRPGAVVTAIGDAVGAGRRPGGQPGQGQRGGLRPRPGRDRRAGRRRAAPGRADRRDVAGHQGRLVPVAGLRRPSRWRRATTYARTVGRTLTAAGLVDVREDADDTAQLVVVVTAPTVVPAPATDVTTAHVELEAGLREQGGTDDRVAVVVAGPNSDGLDGTDVGAIRTTSPASSELSTVDVADLPSGVVTTVLAGKEQMLGRQGHYGALARADDALPAVPVR